MMQNKEKRMLFFYPHNFYEMSAGTHRRVHDLLAYMKGRGFLVDLLSLDGFTNSWDDEDAARRELFDSIRICEWKPSILTRLILGAQRRVGALPDRAIPRLRKNFKEMTAQRRYGHVIISYVYWATLADLVPYDTVKVIDLHDFVTLNKYMITGKGEFRLGRMFEGEVRAISKFDYALSISREETLMLSPFCPGTKFVDAPVSFPKRFLNKRAHDFDLLFFGSDNAFNLEGIKWFMKEVYPLLPATVRIAVAGRAGGHVEKKENITLIPHVSDIDEVYSRSKLSFCPLKGGTGLKVKVVEALSYGMPVVTTSWGLSGFLQKNDNGCLVADSADEFARGALLLLDNENEYQRFRQKAEDYFLRHYSIDTWEKTLDNIFLV